ncbi:MAG: GerMN domain-containing protein [Nitrospinae bacterium]|nr:GerMN domain-containing protein [Nitrospinota bacterium]
MKRKCLVILLALLLSSPALAQNAPAPPAPAQGKMITVFLANQDGKLSGEPASIARDPILEKEIKSAVEAIFTGAPRPVEALPKTAKLNTVFLDGKKNVYLDFSEELINDHFGGITRDILSVSSICKTVFTNFDVEGIRILVKGKEISSIAGHVDLESKITHKKCDALAFYRKD